MIHKVENSLWGSLYNFSPDTIISSHCIYKLLRTSYFKLECFFRSPTILHWNKRHVVWICITVLCTPIFHFTVFSHTAELIILDIKISFFWTEHPASQKMRKYSAIEFVTNACFDFFFFFGKLCQTQTVSGVHFTFKRKDQFLGGSYILHITVKNCVYFILFLQPKNCNKTVFSLQLLFTKIAFKKIARFPFWELCYFKYVFFLYFFASCENFYKTASIWIFYDYSSVIWVILSM